MCSSYQFTNSNTCHAKYHLLNDKCFTESNNVTIKILNAVTSSAVPTAIILNTNVTSIINTPNVWIAIGASTGGAIFIIIGVVILCAMKLKQQRRRGEYEMETTSPFDNIHMNTSTTMYQEEVTNTNEATDVFCELNASYECLRTRTVTTQPTENIYATVQ